MLNSSSPTSPHPRSPPHSRNRPPSLTTTTTTTETATTTSPTSPTSSTSPTSPNTRHHRRRSSVVIPLDLLRPLHPETDEPPVVNHHHRCPSGAMPCNRKCWATLLTRPSYLPGAILLHHSLQKHHSQYPLLILTTPSFPKSCLAVLDTLGIAYMIVEPLVPEQNVTLIASRFEDSWTKLRVFELVGYETVILLDADMLIRRNMDDLFKLKLPGMDWIAANHACVCNITHEAWAPEDWTEPNCPYTNLHHPAALTHPASVPSGPLYPLTQPQTHTLLNSGLVILHPSTHLFNQLLHLLHTSPLISTFLFPDQDLLTEAFRGKWLPLGWQYNAIKTSRYQHPNIWRDEEVRGVHYIMEKPWDVGRTENGIDAVCNRWWWDEWDEWDEEWDEWWIDWWCWWGCNEYATYATCVWDDCHDGDPDHNDDEADDDDGLHESCQWRC